MLTERLGKIRSTVPKKVALFTGRDQMQALTGLFARQFGTPNYAAHDGFCSVNMAAGMIYAIGGSSWEFGGPDLDRAKLFVMIGTAEDHHSNPMKIAIGKFKRAGGRFMSINPLRSGYSAIVEEWIPIKPGTDSAVHGAAARADPSQAMNLAFSVVIFTTIAGAAQGLVVTLALGVLAGLPMTSGFVSTELVVAEVMLRIGLGESFAHLGQSGRAWRAVLMWHTSWLQRVAIVLPAFIGFNALWWLGLRLDAHAPMSLLPLAAIAAAGMLRYCTAMIYAGLRFIQDWA